MEASKDNSKNTIAAIIESAAISKQIWHDGSEIQWTRSGKARCNWKGLFEDKCEVVLCTTCGG